jgi:hypothetical protein
VGKQSHPAKVGHQPEASFASSPVRAARSVNSQCQSRVIEPRNKLWLEPWPSARRGQHRRADTGQAWRSGRGLRAGQRHKRVLWEHGRPVNVLGDNDRERMDRLNNIQATPSGLLDGVERSSRSQPKVTWTDREREGRVRRDGSLSGFIVPRKAGERGRPEPGSREGNRPETEPS